MSHPLVDHIRVPGDELEPTKLIAAHSRLLIDFAGLEVLFKSEVGRLEADVARLEVLLLRETAARKRAERLLRVVLPKPDPITFSEKP